MTDSELIDHLAGLAEKATLGPWESDHGVIWIDTREHETPTGTGEEGSRAVSRYADIIDQLEAAEGPNYELERLVHDAVAPDGPTWVACGSPAYTASLDAAVGLVERVLPGATVRLNFITGSSWNSAQVHRYDGYPAPQENGKGEAKTAALSTLLALFHALQSQENSSE